MVLLDSSGSMTVPAEKWRLARLLAGDIVAHASASSQLALVTFSGEIRGIWLFGRTFGSAQQNKKD